jgi:hypothetical protein
VAAVLAIERPQDLHSGSSAVAQGFPGSVSVVIFDAIAAKERPGASHNPGTYRIETFA